jgi:hypothetical protein
LTIFDAPVKRKPAKENNKNLPQVKCSMPSKYPKEPEKATVIDKRNFNSSPNALTVSII